MKKIFIIAMAVLITVSLFACSPNPPNTEPENTDATEPLASATAPLTTSAITPFPLPSATIEPTPLPTPELSPTPLGETPDQAGSGDVMFDIYVTTAYIDLNNDGTAEELMFTKGSSESTLTINGVDYTVGHSGLAQLFAVTDIDVSDSQLELAFTDKYDSELADTEFPFTWLYWWDGTKLTQMGGLMNVKFDGAWRSSFNPNDHFDAHGLVKCLTRTQNFTDIWYTGHYEPNGTDRKLAEKPYEAKPLYHPEPVRTKQYILLLKKRTNEYFDPSYSVMWDYASGCGGYAWKPREYSDDIVAFIPQSGEDLTIAAVYGKQWFKLMAADGKQGWLRCKDMKVYGYWPTMGADYTADNLFDNIVVAG